MTRLIGLSGRARAGKDTVAGFLVKNHGFVQVAFADILKRMCRDMMGFADDQLWGETKDVIDDRWGLTPRHAMQQLGTEVGRCIHPDVWVRATMRTAVKLLTAGGFYTPNGGLVFATVCRAKPVVISDVRFPNEAAAIHDAGGQVWRVHRFGDSVTPHPSETALDDYEGFDCHIHNENLTLTDLEWVVAGVLESPT